MRSLLSIIIALIFILPSAQCQFGISAEFRSYPVVELESKIGHSIFDLNYGGSVDYWLRLKNYRWEMMPTISASYSSPKSVDNTLISQIGLFTGRFQFKNNFYLLDFKNDCNCPTFSKQNGWFKKSFYVQAAPAYAFNQYKLESRI